MLESTATIRLKAVDTNVATTINNVSAASTNALISATALSAGFKILEKASSSNVAQMSLGANNSYALASSFGKLASEGNKVTAMLSKVSNLTFFAQQAAIATEGIAKAADKYARLPEAIAVMQSSGVSTQPIEQFNNLTAAIKGSDTALNSLVTNSLAELGRFEQAAARAGTILKSSLRVDAGGNPAVANAGERMQNALSVQKLVTDELNNSVSSTDALLGQYEVLSSGFTNVKDSQAVLKEGLKLITVGKAGGVSADPTATLQLLTKTLNAYELSAEDAGKVATTLNAIVENGLTTIPELSQVFGQLSSQTSKANIGLVDTAAAIAVLTTQGVSTAESSTGIARISSNIISKTPEAEAELAKLQIRGEKIRFDKAEIQAKGFTQALIDLYDAAGGSSEILSKIFPEDVAYRTVNALLTQQGKKLKDNRDLIAGTDYSKFQQIVDASQSDRTSRFERIANRFNESIIQIGIELAPAIEPGIKSLENLAAAFSNIPDPIKKMIGQYLAFKIQSKAVGGAVFEFIKTIAKLATNYLLVRTVSLALTGQLGREINTIRSLAAQRKGLASITLQAIGVDQRWRLEQMQTNEVIAKQGAIANRVAAIQQKISQTAKTAFTKGVAITSRISDEEAIAILNRRKQQIVDLTNKAKNVAVDKTKQAVDRTRDRFPNLNIDPEQFKTIPTIIPPIPKAVATPQLNNKSVLNNLIASDPEIVKATQAKAIAKQELSQLQQKKNAIANQLDLLTNQINKGQQKLDFARQKAIADPSEKNYAKVKKLEADVASKGNLLQDQELEYNRANTQSLIAKNRIIEANTKLQALNYAARGKYAAIAKSLVTYQELETIAIKKNEIARIAKIQAEQAEQLIGAKSRVTMTLKSNAYVAERAAIRATEAASKQKAITDALTTKITRAQYLAENQLYEARIFGRTVALTEIGIMGKINKVLITNIALSKAGEFATTGLAKAKAALVAITKISNIQLGLENAKLAALNVKSFTSGIFNLFKAGIGKGSDLFGTLIKPLGATAPLLGAATIAAIALRSELFGIGRDTRIINKEFKDYLQKQSQLNSDIAKRTGLTSVENKLDTPDLKSSGIDRDLLALKDSGALTAEQFNRLNTAFGEAANGGAKATEKLQELRVELNKVKSGAVEIEKGFYDNVIDGAKKIPSGIGKVIGGVVDGVFNTIAVIPNNIIKNSWSAAKAIFTDSPLQLDFISPWDIAADRQAAKVLTRFNVLGKYQADAGDRFNASTQSIISYRQNLALTSGVQQKVAQGIKLTTQDLTSEKNAYADVADLNRAAIEGLEAQITLQKEKLTKVKPGEFKDQLEREIQNTIRSKEALEGRNEQLKAQQENSEKYLTETLPAIQVALKETSSPGLALANVQKEFEQKYILDAEGKATKLLKPLEVLRDDAAKVVDQINENVALGLFDSFGSGELAAAAKIKAVRDEQISFMENGELVTGYRLTLAQRQELTARIIELENAEAKRTETRIKIETDLLSSRSQYQLESAETVAVKLAEIQSQSISKAIAEKEKEIATYKALGVRTIDQELELEQLLASQKSQVYATETAKLEQEIAKRERLRKQELLESSRQIFDYQRQITFASQENAIADFDLQGFSDRINNYERLGELSKSVANNDLFAAKQQQAISTANLANLKAQLPIQQFKLKNEIAIAEKQKQQQLLEAQSKESEAELAQFKAEEQLYFVRRNQGSQEAIANAQIVLENSQLQLEQAKEATANAEFDLDLSRQTSSQKQTQATLQSQIAEYSQRNAANEAKNAIVQAQITQQNEAQLRAVESRSKSIELSSEKSKSIFDYRTGELNLALQVANTEQEKLKTAQQLANLKLVSLRSQIASEAQILALSQAQAKLQLDLKQSKTQGELTQNLSAYKTAQANLNNLITSGASEEQINIGRSELEALLAQRQGLVIRDTQEAQERNILERSQALERTSFSRSAELRVDTARVEAVEALPEEKRKIYQDRLYNEFKNNLDLTGLGSVGQNINALKDYQVRVPQIQIPQVELPTLNDIRNDLRSLINQNNQPAGRNNQPQSTKPITISNLQFDNPINININGADDKNAIAKQVESTVFGAMVNMLNKVSSELQK